ncbi:MAG: hypothetical protein IPI67_13305 [Myxococcales bacterium]|nr:hypothetical protein [Myxococcales bacterium]
MQKLAPDSVADFIRAELDKVALAHSTFTDDALSLIVRSSEASCAAPETSASAPCSKPCATAPKPST